MHTHTRGECVPHLFSKMTQHTHTHAHSYESIDRFRYANICIRCNLIRIFRAKAVSLVCFAFGRGCQNHCVFLFVSSCIKRLAGLFSFHLVFDDSLWTTESICVQTNAMNIVTLEPISLRGKSIENRSRCQCVCDNFDPYLFWMANHSAANTHAIEITCEAMCVHQTVRDGEVREGSFLRVARWFEYHTQLRHDSLLK